MSASAQSSCALLGSSCSHSQLLRLDLPLPCCFQAAEWTAHGLSTAQHITSQHSRRSHTLQACKLRQGRSTSSSCRAAYAWRRRCTRSRACGPLSSRRRQSSRLSHCRRASNSAIASPTLPAASKASAAHTKAFRSPSQYPSSKCLRASTLSPTPGRQAATPSMHGGSAGLHGV